MRDSGTGERLPIYREVAVKHSWKKDSEFDIRIRCCDDAFLVRISFKEMRGSSDLPGTQASRQIRLLCADEQHLPHLHQRLVLSSFVIFCHPGSIEMYLVSWEGKYYVGLAP